MDGEGNDATVAVMVTACSGWWQQEEDQDMEFPSWGRGLLEDTGSRAEGLAAVAEAESEGEMTAGRHPIPAQPRWSPACLSLSHVARGPQPRPPQGGSTASLFPVSPCAGFDYLF